MDTTPYLFIADQHVENASFLWELRSIAVNQPHYHLADINELDVRIEAQLDGIMTFKEAGWNACLQAIKLQQPGDIFTAAIIAFKSLDPHKIEQVVVAGLKNNQIEKGLISALGWLPRQIVQPWIKKFFNSKELNHKYLAVAASSVRRENPGEILNRILDREDCKLHVKLYARSLRLIGELKRQDLLPALIEARQVEDKFIRFWSSYSSLLLGDQSSVKYFKPFIYENSHFQKQAINLIFRVLPLDQARKYVSELVSEKISNRVIIKATAAMGDPQAINWLIKQMHTTSDARLAAEAFSQITGTDIELQGLSIKHSNPEDSTIHFATDEDDSGLDEDEHLPWPDIVKVKTYWVMISGQFIAGQRYFMGALVNNSNDLNDVLQRGNQRQRYSASIERAILSPASALYNTRSRTVQS